MSLKGPQVGECKKRAKATHKICELKRIRIHPNGRKMNVAFSWLIICLVVLQTFLKDKCLGQASIHLPALFNVTKRNAQMFIYLFLLFSPRLTSFLLNGMTLKVRSEAQKLLHIHYIRILR